MPSLHSRLFNFTASKLFRSTLSEFDTQKMRRKLANGERYIPRPKGMIIEKAPLKHCDSEWVYTKSGEDSGRVILYFPGGAWVLRSPRLHRRIAAKIARAANAKVRLVFYRLAPEHPFPAGLEDCIEAYENIIAQGISPSRIVIGGDSAGGNLCFASLLALRDKGAPLPAAAFALSPGIDLENSPESNSDIRDPLFSNSDFGANDPRKLYVSGQEELLKHPYVSPMNAELKGLCPLLVHVGSVEMLKQEALDFISKAKKSGVSAELEIWEGQPHLWHGMFFPESQMAVNHIGDFVRHHSP